MTSLHPICKDPGPHKSVCHLALLENRFFSATSSNKRSKNFDELKAAWPSCHPWGGELDSTDLDPI